MYNKKVENTLNNVKEHGWQVVNLRNCGLTQFPQELFYHPDIVTIDLGNDEFTEEENRNRISNIPDDIGKIKNLRTLNLEYNQITSISDELSGLQNLAYLNLKNNRLKELPEKIANMEQLKRLEIINNPFEILPPEIAARGIDSIRNFFKELKEQDFIYEVKLIIVGEGRVGKTCLSEALINDDYELNDEESTEGINIDRWVIPTDEIKKINSEIERDFQINIWDFGGQEIYHSTHQFFLTKRSIYLLVTESRKEDRHDDFFYWLNIIQLLGDKSPVMMVLNKCDQPTKELPIKEYQSAFSNIISFNKISLKKDFKHTLQEFKNLLKKEASKMPHIGTPLPKVWVDIRREIEDLKLDGKAYISRDEYLTICKRHFRREDSALFISEYFHDLGVIIHFQNDVELRDIVILNHEWITKGVYKVLDDKKVIDQNGKFSTEDIIRIWSDHEYKSRIKELISLMKNTKFDLCFELKSGEYLIPRLLPVDEVSHNWESSPNNVKFEFEYKFMPKGILARLIVKMNSDIHEDTYWRYGVVLKYEDTRAIVREKYFENKIAIELNGENKREFLYLIRKTINEIHKDFTKLIVKEMIPCNCEVCKSTTNPHFYEYNLLRRYEAKELKKIRCDLSLEEVSVFELTSNIAKKALSNEKYFACENKNAGVLQGLDFPNANFFPENDSATVFIKTSTNPDYYGIRDRDYLLDSEIEKIEKEYKNYFILDYYCFENYLYHPENLNELNLEGFDYNLYIKDLVQKKNDRKDEIVSVFKGARKTYQEFKGTMNNFKDPKNENQIIEYLKSDDIEIFFKAFSIKSYYRKDYLAKYQLTIEELSKTNWFRKKISEKLQLGEND